MKIYIFTIIALTLLSSCMFDFVQEEELYIQKHDQSKYLVSKIEDRINKVNRDNVLNVDYEFVVKDSKISIYINNNKLGIISARAWISFPSNNITMHYLNINKNKFNLIAPGENKIDQKAGLIKIGAASDKIIKDKRVLLADFSFNKKSDQSLMIACYDYNLKTDSHCSVKNKESKNILNKPDVFIIN